MDSKTYATGVGETVAKLYFETKGYFVYSNSSGKSEFDLVLSKDKELYTVEVKTVSSLQESTKGAYFEVQLKTVRSNKTENTIKSFNKAGLDYLVVVNLLDLTIVVLDAEEIEAKSSLRIYTSKFKPIIGGLSQEVLGTALKAVGT